MKKKNKKTLKQIGFTLLITLLVLGLQVFKQTDITSLFQDITHNFNLETENKASDNFSTIYEQELDACDITTVTKAEARVNISIDGIYDYWSYTDEYGRIIKVTADELHLKSETGRDSGQYCDSRFPSNSSNDAKDSKDFITGGTDDRGHLIGDQFNGVSNAYNILAQDRTTNQSIYLEIETYMADILKVGGSITDFEINVAYEDIDINRPISYEISMRVNGEIKGYFFYNDGSVYVEY